MKRKQRSYEWTCRCGAYRFPHRFTGGKCTGKWLVRKAWDNNYGYNECASCNCMNDDTNERYCEVLTGQENVTECMFWQEFVQYNEIRVYKKGE